MIMHVTVSAGEITFSVFIFCCPRIVVVLDTKISIFNFTRTPQELHQIETAHNAKGKRNFTLK